VLQSLAATQLQIELAQRLCQLDSPKDAVAELELASEQLQMAAAALQEVMRDLQAERAAPQP